MRPFSDFLRCLFLLEHFRLNQNSVVLAFFLLHFKCPQLAIQCSWLPSTRRFSVFLVKMVLWFLILLSLVPSSQHPSRFNPLSGPLRTTKNIKLIKILNQCIPQLLVVEHAETQAVRLRLRLSFFFNVFLYKIAQGFFHESSNCLSGVFLLMYSSTKLLKDPSMSSSTASLGFFFNVFHYKLLKDPSLSSPTASPVFFFNSFQSEAKYGKQRCVQ